MSMTGLRPAMFPGQLIRTLLVVLFPLQWLRPPVRMWCLGGGGGGVGSVVSPQGSGSGLPFGTSVSLVESEPMTVDVRDKELDELASQPLLASESGVVGDGVLVPSPSDRVLEASASQAGVSQVEGLQSSPSFSPLSGSVLSVTPSSAVSEEVDGSASVVLILGL